MNSSVAQGVGSVLGQVGLALRGLTGAALVGGDVVGRLAAVGPYLFMGQITAGLRGNDIASFRRLATRYSRFPPISAPSSLVNSAGLIAPVLLITALYGPLAGGSFTLAQRLVGAPMSLIGAVSQVYVAQLGGMLRIGDLAAMRRLFRRYTGTLLKFGAPPILVLSAVSPWLFARLLGPQWEVAGRMTRALAPLLLAYFAVYPLSLTLNLLERQGLQFVWDCGRLTAVVVVISACHALGWTPVAAVGAAGITLAGCYAILALLGYQAIRQRTTSSPARAAATS